MESSWGMLGELFLTGYVGPGAGLTAIGALIAIVAAVILLIVGFVWYPLRRMMRAVKSKKNDVAESPKVEVPLQPTAAEDDGKN